VFLPDSRYGGGEKSYTFYRAWHEKLAALPGVTSATIGFPMPFSNMNLGIPYSVDGRPPAPAGHEPVASLHIVSPTYFATLGIPVRAGRVIEPADDRKDAAPVMVINAAMARQIFGDGPAVGKRL